MFNQHDKDMSGYIGKEDILCMLLAADKVGSCYECFQKVDYLNNFKKTSLCKCLSPGDLDTFF